MGRRALGSRDDEKARKGIVGMVRPLPSGLETWGTAHVGGTDGVEACIVEVVKGLVTHRLSPTSAKREVRACSTAGPIFTLECSSERSILPAEGAAIYQAVAKRENGRLEMKPELWGSRLQIRSGRQGRQRRRRGAVLGTGGKGLRSERTALLSDHSHMVFYQTTAKRTLGRLSKESLSYYVLNLPVKAEKPRLWKKKRSGPVYRSRARISAAWGLLYEQLTSTFLSGGFLGMRVLPHLEEGTETTRVEGVIPIRELPFGGSLLRMAVANCSNSFMCTLG
ncbi:hypothetical protein F5887DRAFT_915167 [Amanita rubescens]|nr:hypothetical protein F5887DRAFT_915167 [Amanita rubescens]